MKKYSARPRYPIKQESKIIHEYNYQMNLTNLSEVYIIPHYNSYPKIEL